MKPFPTFNSVILERTLKEYRFLVKQCIIRSYAKTHKELWKEAYGRVRNWFNDGQLELNS